MLGETVTVATAGGVVPLLAVHAKGPAPPDVKVTLCPTQIVDNDGVILIEGVLVTETVADAELVQVPVPVITV
mgnify:CR=1 FL=1